MMFSLIPVDLTFIKVGHWIKYHSDLSGIHCATEIDFYRMTVDYVRHKDTSPIGVPLIFN